MSQSDDVKRPPAKRFIIRNLLTGQYYCRKKTEPVDPVNDPHCLGEYRIVYFRDDPKRAKVFYSEGAAKNACHHIHQTTRYAHNDTSGQDLDLDHNLEIIPID